MGRKVGSECVVQSMVDDQDASSQAMSWERWRPPQEFAGAPIEVRGKLPDELDPRVVSATLARDLRSTSVLGHRPGGAGERRRQLLEGLRAVRQTHRRLADRQKSKGSQDD